MKTDRELLELAAKAAGLHRNRWDYEYCRNHGHMVCRSDMWDPLTNDGDAQRLAVKLGMTVEVCLEDECTRILDEFSRVVLRQMHVDGDAGAATRRAIVRAAAAIGEAK